jgi:hypothetical protein
MEQRSVRVSDYRTSGQLHPVGARLALCGVLLYNYLFTLVP